MKKHSFSRLNPVSEPSNAKRLDFLKSKWDELMAKQDTMSTAEILATGFQKKRRRIANLYQWNNEQAMRPRRDAIRKALEAVGPQGAYGMVKLPTGKITFEI